MVWIRCRTELDDARMIPTFAAGTSTPSTSALTESITFAKRDRKKSMEVSFQIPLDCPE